MKAEDWDRAFAILERVLKDQSESPYLLALRGDLIQLLDMKKAPPLKEAAASYLKALKLNPNNLEVIASLAHFYDAVDPKPAKAKQYAQEYIDKTRETISAMERIVTETADT